jgi:hypothetical protein
MVWKVLTYGLLVVKPGAREPLYIFGMDGRIILIWIVRKQGGRMWTGFIWLRIGTGGRLL